MGGVPRSRVVRYGIFMSLITNYISFLVKRYRKLDGLNNRNVFSHHSGGCKSKIEYSCFLLRAVRKNLFHTSQLLVTSGFLPHVDDILSVSTHCLPSVCVSLCAQNFPFNKNASHTGLGPP